MPTYEMDNGEVARVVKRMEGLYHPELRDAEVTYDILVAFCDKDEDGNPIGDSPVKCAGYPCAAVIRITKYKERVAGRADVEITVDGEQWPTFSPEEQDALIDHEITHCELQTDDDGAVKRDDQDRPKLRLLKHDRFFGWFDSCARRHGRASAEVRQFEDFRDGAFKQLWFPYLDEPDRTPVVLPPKDE